MPVGPGNNQICTTFPGMGEDARSNLATAARHLVECHLAPMLTKPNRRFAPGLDALASGGCWDVVAHDVHAFCALE